MIEEIAAVGAAYANYVDTFGGAPDRLNVEVMEADEYTLAGSYHIKKSDAQMYADGEISGEEYADRIISTISTNE